MNKMRLICPRCGGEKIVKNGHPYKGKQQWRCNNNKCNKYFSENTAKGYPHTKFPFPFIADMLYFRKNVEKTVNTKRSLKSFRKTVNRSAWLTGIKKRDLDQKFGEWLKKGNGIHRQTIHHWIKTYDKVLETIISPKVARDFVDGLLDKEFNLNNSIQSYKGDPTKEVLVIKTKRRSHMDALKILQIYFGEREDFRDFLRNHESIFNKLLERVSTYEVRVLEHRSLL